MFTGEKGERAVTLMKVGALFLFGPLLPSLTLLIPHRPKIRDPMSVLVDFHLDLFLLFLDHALLLPRYRVPSSHCECSFSFGHSQKLRAKFGHQLGRRESDYL